MEKFLEIDQLVSDCMRLYFAVSRTEPAMPDRGEELFTLASAASHLWQALEYLEDVRRWRENGVQMTMELKGGANGTRI